MPASKSQRQSSEPGNERSQKGYAIESGQLASTKPHWKHSPFHRSLRGVSYLCGLPSQKCLLPNTSCLGLTNPLPVFRATPFLVSNQQGRGSTSTTQKFWFYIKWTRGRRWGQDWKQVPALHPVTLLVMFHIPDCVVFGESQSRWPVMSLVWDKNSDQEGHFYSQININYSRHASRFYLPSSLGQGVINSVKKDKGVTYLASPKINASTQAFCYLSGSDRRVGGKASLGGSRDPTSSQGRSLFSQGLGGEPLKPVPVFLCRRRKKAGG